MAYYAWSPITADGKKFKIGDEVTKDDLPDDFDNLVASGVLRKQKYPSDIRSDESPRNAMLRKLNDEVKKVQEGFDNPLAEDEEEASPRHSGKKFWEQ